MRLGVFGGTFNPVHYGHLRAAEEVRERIGLDKVLFVPAGTPPLKSSELAEAPLRLSMTELAVSSNGFFEVSDMEIKRKEKSYSVDTVKELEEAYRDSERFFILGMDAFLEISSWKEPERLITLIDFIIMTRPPYKFSDIESSPYVEKGGVREEAGGIYSAVLAGGRKALLLGITALDISATGIRRLVRGGESIRYLLPESVESFIMSNGLYGAT